MCLGVPGKLIAKLESQGGLDFGTVDFGGVRRRVCISCVRDSVPGDYVIVHAGIAISQVDADEAQRILKMLEELGDAELLA